METTACNVIYVDRRVREDRTVTRERAPRDDDWEAEHIAENVKLLVDIFGSVFLCSTGGACLTQWLNMQDTSMIEMKPTLLLLDTPFEDWLPEPSRSRSPSPHSLTIPDVESENHETELYGLSLLQRVVSESYLRNLSRLVVAVPLIVFPRPKSFSQNLDGARVDAQEVPNGMDGSSPVRLQRNANRRMVKKCLDCGASDIMGSPMNAKCINNLETLAYRAHRDATREQKALLEVRRGRKRSWVGISEDKPFSYLREAMVSNLMNGICRIDNENDDGFHNVTISVPAESLNRIAGAIGQWHFCAHAFSDDELIVAAACMFKHALSMPELERWRLPTDQLHNFLIACRAAYNTFVPYHNFRHVVDVLQATFDFLVKIGSLPPYPSNENAAPIKKSPIAKLLRPFEALTLLITAIGHDVGHPGVNNGFLVTLNAPLAQLYNDRSVLESFHCAAYSQILRRHWPAAFSDTKMRNLMISSILATDMGLHFDYMKKLGDLQEQLKDGKSVEGWADRTVNEHKALACALLIKCADISNVARRHDTALQWMHVLAEEFSRQASMESQLEIPSSLVAAPKRDMLSLSKAQLSFMNLFAIPLFQGVADILPSLQYTVDELSRNEDLFQQLVAEEQSTNDTRGRQLKDASYGPRAQSSVTSPEPDDLSSAPPTITTHDSTSNGFLTQTADAGTKPAHVPVMSPEYHEVNGVTVSFNTVADYARNDPFGENGIKSCGAGKQRGSEATEGGSVPCSGDWASQATSATTGKMPLSPSTQGTSIVSRDSMERPTSVSVTNITAPESTATAPEMRATRESRSPDVSHQATEAYQGPGVNGTVPVLEAEAKPGNLLKKKSSRFMMNSLAFFRRHKSPSPPIRRADVPG